MTKLCLSQQRDPIRRIKDLEQNLKRLEDAEPEIDATGVRYVTPLTILPLAVRISKLAANRAIDFRTEENLKAIKFPIGAVCAPSPGGTLPIWKADLGGGKRSSSAIIEEISTQYGKFIYDHLHAKKEIADNYQDSISYALSEMCDNVDQHAEADSIWLYARFWPTRGELEFALVDDGIGMSRCYNKRGYATKDDCDALVQAVDGVSSKGSVDRGFGIGTTARLLCSGELRGEFVLISGTGCYLKCSGRQAKVGHLGIRWRGVVVSCRLCRPDGRVDYLKYIS